MRRLRTLGSCAHYKYSIIIIIIREVSLEKENLTIVLASENQLAELAKYSTSELDFSIVQLDPTFNLGPYECTPISYRNLLLKSKRSGTSPVRLGPVLIHCRKDERTFREFLQTVVDAKQKLKEILVARIGRSR